MNDIIRKIEPGNQSDMSQENKGPVRISPDKTIVLDPLPEPLLFTPDPQFKVLAETAIIVGKASYGFASHLVRGGLRILPFIARGFSSAAVTALSTTIREGTHIIETDFQSPTSIEVHRQAFGQQAIQNSTDIVLKGRR